MNSLEWLEQKRHELEEDIKILNDKDGNCYLDIIKEKSTGLYYLWIDEYPYRNGSKKIKIKYLKKIIKELKKERKLNYSNYRNEKCVEEDVLYNMFEFHLCSDTSLYNLLTKNIAYLETLIEELKF